MRRLRIQARKPVILFVGADLAYMLAFRGALISRYRAVGYRTVVLATPHSGLDPRQFDMDGIEFVPWSLKKAGLNPFRDLPALWLLWKTLAKYRPRVIFAHTIKPVIYSMWLSWLARVPRRVTMIPGLGYTFTKARGFKRLLLSKIAKVAYAAAFRSAHVVLLQNQDDGADLVSSGVLPGLGKVRFVDGSGVDMARFPLSPIPEGPTTFLMVARLIRDKGVYDFVEAARHVRSLAPETRFVLVGAADANPEAVPAADIAVWRSEGLVEVRGHLEDPRAAFSDCHVFVLPSYYREGIPRTNLEALSTGRAIITTDTPGCRETVIQGVNGFIVPPRNVAALADAMLLLANDRDRLRAMGIEGRKYCEHRFELEAVTEATFRYMEGQKTNSFGASLQVQPS